VRIERCELEHSIVLADSTLEGLDGRIESSLVDRGVSVGRSPRVPRAYRLVVGDNAQIAIL
jgi:glucose-1-phosphate thymidylyltransferase